MSLIDEFMTPCKFMDKVHQSDGMGGFSTAWTEGASLSAAIVKNNSLSARIAEKEGVKEVYTITTARGVGLVFNDVIKRISDGSYFRIKSNSNDTQSPASSNIDLESVSAEKVEVLT